MFAPRNTSTALLDRIATAMKVALDTDVALRKQLEAGGYYVSTAGSRADFESFLRAEKQRLGKIVGDSGMTLD